MNINKLIVRVTQLLVWHVKKVAYELVPIDTFTINDLLFLKLEWVPEELLIMNPVNVTEVNI